MKTLTELFLMDLRDIKNLLVTYNEIQLYSLELEIESLNYDSYYTSKVDDISEIISDMMMEFEEVDDVAMAFSTMFY